MDLFSGVCTLRLDFESFTTVGPTDTVETNGGECTDTFTVTVIIIEWWPMPKRWSEGSHSRFLSFHRAARTRRCPQSAGKTLANTVRAFSSDISKRRLTFCYSRASVRWDRQSAGRYWDPDVQLCRFVKSEELGHQSVADSMWGQIQVRRFLEEFNERKVSQIFLFSNPKNTGTVGFLKL